MTVSFGAITDVDLVRRRIHIYLRILTYCMQHYKALKGLLHVDGKGKIQLNTSLNDMKHRRSGYTIEQRYSNTTS